MVTESWVRSCHCGPKELPWPVGLSRGLALSTEQVGQVGNAEDSSAWFPSEGWEGKPCSAWGCSPQPTGWCTMCCVWRAFLGGFQQEGNVLGWGFWGGRLLLCHLHLVANVGRDGVAEKLLQNVKVLFFLSPSTPAKQCCPFFCPVSVPFALCVGVPRCSLFHLQKTASAAREITRPVPGLKPSDKTTGPWWVLLTGGSVPWLLEALWRWAPHILLLSTKCGFCFG